MPPPSPTYSPAWPTTPSFPLVSSATMDARPFSPKPTSPSPEKTALSSPVLVTTTASGKSNSPHPSRQSCHGKPTPSRFPTRLALYCRLTSPPCPAPQATYSISSMPASSRRYHPPCSRPSNTTTLRLGLASPRPMSDAIFQSPWPPRLAI